MHDADFWVMVGDLLSFCVLLILVIHAIVFGKQAKTFQEQSSILAETLDHLKMDAVNREQFDKQRLRAYLSVSVDHKDSVQLIQINVWHLTCSFSISNGGSTPAKKVRLYIGSKMCSRGEVLTDDFVKGYCLAINTSDIAKGGIVYKPFFQDFVDEQGVIERLVKSPYSRPEWDELKVFGLVEYEGVVDGNWKTQFCFEVQVISDGTFRLQSSQDYNDAT